METKNNRKRIHIKKSELMNLTFFLDLENQIAKYIDYEKEEKYIIWGGVAVNLMLQFYKISNVFYSLHDIELFLVLNNKINNSKLKLIELEKDLNEKFLIQIGGLPIIEKFEGISIDDFQNNRINLKDGDLYINNIVIEVQKNEIIFDGPFSIINNLLNGKLNLELKNIDELISIERISRRLFRTISKSIRFNKIANLYLSEKSEKTVRELILKFKDLIKYSIENIEFNNWIIENKISTIDSGFIWLYTKTVIETTKRIAGILEINSLDKISFINELFNPADEETYILNEKYFKYIEFHIEDKEYFKIYCLEELPILCFKEYQKYQKPNAEKLLKIYSN